MRYLKLLSLLLTGVGGIWLLFEGKWMEGLGVLVLYQLLIIDDSINNAQPTIIMIDGADPDLIEKLNEGEEK